MNMSHVTSSVCSEACKTGSLVAPAADCTDVTEEEQSEKQALLGILDD